MLKDRNELDKKIRSFLSKYYADKEITNKIKDVMLEKGWNLGEITRTINLSISVEGLTDNDACLLTKAISLAEPNFIDYKKYFNEKEIDGMERHIKEKKEKENTLVFHNVTEGARDENGDIKYFICPMYSMYELQEAFQINHLLGYDENFQRELTRYKEKDGEITAKIERDPKKIADISTRILENEFYPSQLVFYVRNKNMFTDKYKNIKIDEKQKAIEVTINEDTEVLIIDGYSRTLGSMRALTLNETLKNKLNTYFNVIIGIWTDEEAGALIKQINEQTPFNFNKIEVIGSKNSPAMNITKVINNAMNEINNVLFHKFAETENILDVDKTKWCLFNTFSRAIEYNFTKKKKLEEYEPKELQDLVDHIIKGFNEIVYQIKALDKDLTIALSPNSFIGYIAMLSILQDDIDWKEKVYAILSDMDFSNKNEELSKINFFAKIINIKVIKKISEYFIGRSAIK